MCYKGRDRSSYRVRSVASYVLKLVRYWTDMTQPTGKRVLISQIDNRTSKDDYVEGTLADVKLTHYDPSKPDAKVVHAYFSESEVCH